MLDQHAPHTGYKATVPALDLLPWVRFDLLDPNLGWPLLVECFLVDVGIFSTPQKEAQQSVKQKVSCQIFLPTVDVRQGKGGAQAKRWS